MNHTALGDMAHAKFRLIVKVVSLIYNILKIKRVFFITYIRRWYKIV